MVINKYYMYYMYKLNSYLTHMYSIGYTSHVLYGVNEQKQKQSLIIMLYILFMICLISGIF